MTQDNTNEITIHDGFAYVSCQHSTNVLEKINLQTFQSEGWLPISAPRQSAVDGGFLYVCDFNGFLHKIDLSTFTNVGNISDLAGANGITIDGGFAYIACMGTDNVYKIDLDTFTNIGSVAVGIQPQKIAIDGGFAYVTCRMSYNIHKIDLDTFTNVGNLLLNKFLTEIVIDNGFAYVSTSTSNSLDKIDLDTFTSVGSLNLLAVSSHHAITKVGDFIYIGVGTNKIYKVKIPDFKSVGVYTAGNRGFGYYNGTIISSTGSTTLNVIPT